MSARTLSLAVSTAVTVVIVALAWLVLAPTQLRGRASFAVTSGISMEPKLHQGDLVVTRVRVRYRVGDVVLYDSVLLDRQVLHRLLAVKGNRFVIKGDNNGFVHRDTPTRDQVRDELWITVPRAGSALMWIREPAHLAIVGFGVVAALGWASPPPERRPVPGACQHGRGREGGSRSTVRGHRCPACVPTAVSASATRSSSGSWRASR